MDLRLVLEALILGLIQGLTEFLPISSSAHLILVPWLLGWNHAVIESLPFDVALHLGTLAAVLAYFAEDWMRLLRAGFVSIVERKIAGDPERRLAWLLVGGSIPGAFVGALAESQVEEVFHAPHAPLSNAAVLAMALLIAWLGLFLFIAERIAKHVRAITDLNLIDALLIGLAQAAAIFPGVSRSGATITAGLFLGLKRDDAARFSFLLGAPIIAGAGLKNTYDVFQATLAGQITGSDLGLYALGWLAATSSGFLTIRFLLRYLQRSSTDIFVYYRWALAVLLISVMWLRGLGVLH